MEERRIDCRSPKSRNFSPPIGYIDGSADRIATININAIVKTAKDSENLLRGNSGLFRKRTPRERRTRVANPINTVERLNEK